MSKTKLTDLIKINEMSSAGAVGAASIASAPATFPTTEKKGKAKKKKIPVIRREKSVEGFDFKTLNNDFIF